MFKFSSSGHYQNKTIKVKGDRVKGDRMTNSKRKTIVRNVTISLCTLISFLILAIAGPQGPAAARPNAEPTQRPTVASDTTVALTVPGKPVKPGNAFDVSVTIQTDTQTRGAQFELHFDPKLVEVTGFDEGDFYKKWAESVGARTIVVPEPEADNAAGTLSSTSVAVLGAAPGAGGAKGSGIVMTIHAKAKDGASGAAEFTLSGVIVADDGGPDGVHAVNLGGVKTQNGRVAIGGGDVQAVAQPTAEALPTATQAAKPTAVATIARRVPNATPDTNLTALESSGNDQGQGGIPWVVVVPVVGLVGIGGAAFFLLRRR
jgi:hypothetical protein